MDSTRFIAFYSYKGGVGRSLALANLAYLLAREGRKVLVIDFDLEAPGQHWIELFKPRQPDSGWPGPGMLELLHDFLAYRKRLSATDSPAPYPLTLDKFLRTAAPYREYQSTLAKSGKADESALGSLWLMPAGNSDAPAYSAMLENLDWAEFYRQHGGAFFRLLKHELRAQGFDDVLIDARTGLSDVFYIATLELAETVVCVSGFNTQNIRGIQRVVQDLQSEPVRKDYGAKRIILVGSPEPVSLTQAERARRLEEIRREWPGFRDFGLTLPYVAELALNEKVLCWEADRTGQEIPYTHAIARLNEQLDAPKPFWADIPDVEEKPVNPFALIRKDYITSDEVVRYFVDPGENILQDMESFMPLIVSGARGSGKTMLASRFSLDAKIAERTEQGLAMEPREFRQIGLYFRIDADFLHTFNQDDEALRNDFNRLFAQFFDIVVIRKALKALELLGGLSNWLDERALFRALFAEFGCYEPDEVSHAAFADFLERQLQRIRFYLNNPAAEHRPVITQPNVLMKLLVEHLRRGGYFGDRYFAILVDEYENYADYQQVIINTRLKQSKREDCVTYRLFMRSGGLRTRDTLAPQQVIEETHDFRAHSLDERLDFDTFRAYVIAVANRHLALTPFFESRGITDIEALLENLDAEEEAKLLARGRRSAPLEKWVNRHFPSQASAIGEWLKSEESPLRQATAVVIMNQGKAVEEVLAAFRGDTKQARDWYHNYHRGALHWICRLYHQDKRYAGLNQIVGLSGNNIRVFLDFCHAIVADWLALKGYQLPVSWKTQDEAIKNQAKIYRENLRTSDRTSREMLNFLDRAGRLFEAAHKNPKQSEPEINHFSIRDKLLDAEKQQALEKWLQNGWYVGILRKMPGNKQKDLKDLRLDDWQLSPWFAPLFNLSTRRKKKLMLYATETYVLFAESEVEWGVLYGKFAKRYDAEDSDGEYASMFDTDKQGSLL